MSSEPQTEVNQNETKPGTAEWRKKKAALEAHSRTNATTETFDRWLRDSDPYEQFKLGMDVTARD